MENKRYNYLDFAKGLAVIFMIVQHIGMWMWSTPWSKIVTNFKDHSIFITLCTFSGISAPIFLFSAGAGAFLLMEKYDDNSKIIKRGIFILLIGYIHNLTITHWFNYGSWYVLHLIGFSFLLVPMLKKMKSSSILILIIGIVIITYLCQTGLKTPLILKNKNMSDMTLEFAFIRLALVEGHFPILPWLTLFLTGFLSVSTFNDNSKSLSIFFIGFSLLLVGTLLVGLGSVFSDFNENALYMRLFFIKPRFYPLVLPMLLFLSGLILIVMQFFKILCDKLKIGENNPLVVLGRFSLTIFFTHIYAKYFLYQFKLNQTYSKSVTMLTLIGVILFFTVLSYLVKHFNYKFTLEGLLRKVSK